MRAFEKKLEIQAFRTGILVEDGGDQYENKGNKDRNVKILLKNYVSTK